MFVLHVEMKVKPGLQKALEDIYRATFNPAIVRQNGFRCVDLLRPFDAEGDYRLSISFEDQASQQKWVATELHQEVWPQIEQQCVSYSVRHFKAV